MILFGIIQHGRVTRPREAPDVWCPQKSQNPPSNPQDYCSQIGLPLDALGVYLPGKLRADNFLLYFRIYGTCIWFPSLKLGGCI